MSEQQSKMSQQEKMVRGTAWSTTGTFVSRLLGALYIIPWYAWMGKYATEANALFGMGYEIYALFLLISTVGIPVAIAKQVSKYNTLGQPEVSIYLVRKVLSLMLGLGVFFSLIMYLGSPFFASLSKGGDALVPVLRSLTLAVLVFPAMSVLRGYFQGLNNMKVYAMSQVAEQLIRVIWMLLTAFFIMKMGSGDYVSAVTQSTFAAFVGMFASIAVLVYYLAKNNLLKGFFGGKPEGVSIDTTAIIVETIKEAIPFIITGSAIQIFKLIDQFTFGNTMSWFTKLKDSDLRVLFAYFSTNPGKVTMILISVATAIGGVGIPLITESFIKKDKVSLARLILNNLQMLLMFIVPAIAGSVILAKSLYAVFYGLPQGQALGLFVASLLQTVLLSLYAVLAPMLQALFENRNAIRYFVYGLIVKVVLQIPSIFLFRAYGPLFSTAIALLVPIILMYRDIQRVSHFNPKVIQKTSFLIVVLTAIMSIVVIVVHSLLNLVLPDTNRLAGFIHLFVGGAAGIAIYGYFGLVTRLLDKLLGSKADSLRQKLHITSVS